MARQHKVEIRIRTSSWFENPKITKLTYKGEELVKEESKPITQWQTKIEI